MQDLQTKTLADCIQENSFIIATFKDFMENHKDKPSTETKIRLENIEKKIDEVEEVNRQSDKKILDAIKAVKDSQEAWMQNTEKRVRSLEDWRLVSVTQRAIAYSISTALGAVAGTLILKAFEQYLF